MRIGALNFSPYIYNTNMLSSSSFSRISAIGDDLTTAKTDYSSLVDDSLNENPLSRGQSASFVDILDMQMQMGRMNASRIMKPAEETQGLEEVQEDLAASEEVFEISDTEAAIQSITAPEENAMDAAEAMEDFQPVSDVQEMLAMQFERNLYQMQKAAEAYRVNMF